MIRGPTGRYEITTVAGEEVRAFLPAPLPPAPQVDLAALQGAMERAHLALGRLDALSTLLPDTRLFLYAYVRKEAVPPCQCD
jgi:hypothetical protein